MTKIFKAFHMLGMAAMASVLVLSCSDNDTAADTATDNGEGINGATSYLGVKVQLVGSSSSRATVGATEFTDGNEAESTVSDVCALFFDKDGKYLTAGQKVNIGPAVTSGNDTDNNIESEPNVVITLGPTTISEGNAPIYMLLFVNDQCSSSWYQKPYGGDSEKVGSFANLIAQNPTLSTVISKYTTKMEPTNEGEFEMTNSVYVDGNSLVQAVPVEAKYFKESRELAQETPVTAYVERTVAKVNMSTTTSTQALSAAKLSAAPFIIESGDNKGIYFPIYTGENLQPFTTNDGTTSETAFAAKVIGAIPNGVNEQGYLIKNLNVPTDDKHYKYYDADNTSSSTKGAWVQWEMSYWNASNNHRSYWAEDMNYTPGATSSSAKDVSRENLKFHTFSDAKDNAFDKSDADATSYAVPSSYVYENTVDQSKDHTWYKTEEQYPNVTTMLVAAQIVPLNGSFDTEQSFQKANDFNSTPVKGATNMWRYEGIFYTNINSIIKKEEEVLKEYYYDDNGTKKQIDDNWITSYLYDNSTSKLTDMKNAAGKSYNGIYYGLRNTDNDNILIYESVSSTEGESVNSVLSAHFKEHKISYFNNGYCFYQVPIEHPTGTDNDADKIYGVVRNHIYNLTLNSISNIGAPVANQTSDETLELIPGKDQYYYIGCTMKVLAWRNVSQTVDL